MKRLLLAFMIVVPLVGAVGCSQQQIAADEAFGYKVLDDVESGLDWLNANPDLVNEALAQAKTKTSNPTALAAIDKAIVANTSGNRTLALKIVQGAKIVLAPPTVPSSVPAVAPVSSTSK